ncbi:MAG: hypothetical protein HGA54_02140 [Actinobacteria bacterium]|nr:hypothetical protein [Actinomycetota bacterium]
MSGSIIGGVGAMKILRVIGDTLLGVLVYAAFLVIQLLVSIPMGYPPTNLTLATLLMAIPLGLVTFALAWLVRTKTKHDAWRRSILWTVVLLVLDVVIMILNSSIVSPDFPSFSSSFFLYFGNISVYVLYVCAFLGPILFAKAKRLN